MDRILPDEEPEVTTKGELARLRARDHLFEEAVEALRKTTKALQTLEKRFCVVMGSASEEGDAVLAKIDETEVKP